MALSVVEQRLDAVRAVLAGASVTEVAASLGVSRQSVHGWVGRYLVERLPGLADRSHRPRSSPGRVVPEVEAWVAELRRAHPRWGAARIRLEMLKRPREGLGVPALRTVNRILTRQGLLVPRRRKRPRSSYRRFERAGPMQLWQIDIVEGVQLVDVVTGEIRVAKVVTGVDDHSRYCVMAQVVERATGRAVCLAFATALARFGVPAEVLTDNGKQFTNRFGRSGGEVLFDKICRKNGITHRLTAPASPNQNGKVERFHGTFGPDFLNDAGPFSSIEDAQAAVDGWAADYNTDRPHQALNPKAPVVPADRFTPVPVGERELLPLWLPPTLAPVTWPVTRPDARDERSSGAPMDAPSAAVSTVSAVAAAWAGGPVEFDRLVPPSGNLQVAGKQFWLGPARAGLVVRLWADCDLIHLLIAGARVKTVRSHLSVNDLARLIAEGATPAGPSPLPPIEDGAAVEIERTVSKDGAVSFAGHYVLAAEILAGRRVGIRIEPATLMFFDLATRELLRTRPNRFTTEQIRRLRGLRPAGPPPRPSTEPVRVQRRAPNTGIVMVVGQKIALGRIHKHQTVTIWVFETTLAIELDDGETRVIRRTTTQPVRNIKADRPRTAPPVS